jgi:hypothetical protein
MVAAMPRGAKRWQGLDLFPDPNRMPMAHLAAAIPNLPSTP